MTDTATDPRGVPVSKDRIIEQLGGKIARLEIELAMANSAVESLQGYIAAKAAEKADDEVAAEVSSKPGK